MAVSNRKKSPVDQILKLVDRLSPEEQSEIRQAFIEDEEDIRVSLYRLKHPAKYISQEELEQKLGLAD